jgi:glutathione peroxidase
MTKFFISILLTAMLNGSSIYNIDLPAADGSVIHLSNYQGKKILFVNTALNSQYTYQLQGLKQLYDLYKDSLEIIAIPSNSFGNEPNDDSTILHVFTNMFSISFPVAGKAEVSGPETDSLYEWLTQQSENNVVNNIVHGDFTKYLVDGSGNLIGIFLPQVEPMDEDIQNTIKGID